MAASLGATTTKNVGGTHGALNSAALGAHRVDLQPYIYALVQRKSRVQSFVALFLGM